MSKQRPLSAAEYRVQQALNAYVQSKAGCPATWYQQWLPLLFKRPCAASVTCYTGLDRKGAPMDDDPTGNSFLIQVSEQDSTLCGRDSTKLKQEARFFARQIRPVLLPGGEYSWITVEYATNTLDCQKVVQFALQDTSTWPRATFFPTFGAYFEHYRQTHQSVSPF